ncbi:hypothetical protein FA13DRAFT_1907328 [Coprinellus micaceus]|uniref:Uncharacterized protein n=1 Tax=Coprinellus micaceus TaxID=71717 RepID=A0A4Y7SS60_COPMI|nr:hypothetical protein FA13DRAFT_1907328 [Coprinellus micaceus]
MAFGISIQRFAHSLLTTFILVATTHSVCFAQKPFPGPPDNLTASVTLWTSNQCCGGAIGFDNIKPDECFALPTNVDSAIYGNSIKFEGLWYERIFVGWGVPKGFSSPNCDNTTQVFDQREPGCFHFPKDRRPRSFSWALETFSYLPPGWGQPWYRSTMNMTDSNTAKDGAGEREGGTMGCRTPNWFEYVDLRLGRSRRIDVTESEELLERVTALYSSKDYQGLGHFDEFSRKRDLHFAHRLDACIVVRRPNSSNTPRLPCVALLLEMKCRSVASGERSSATLSIWSIVRERNSGQVPGVESWERANKGNRIAVHGNTLELGAELEEKFDNSVTVIEMRAPLCVFNQGRVQMKGAEGGEIQSQREPFCNGALV